ncbi:Odorant receptor 417, partial [Nylanderia fulva]
MVNLVWNYYYNVVYKVSAKIYSFVYKLSSVSGLWIYMKPGARIFRLTIVTITLITIFIPQIAFQSTCSKDIYCTFEASTSYLLTVAILLKVYHFQLNISTIEVIFAPCTTYKSHFITNAAFRYMFFFFKITVIDWIFKLFRPHRFERLFYNDRNQLTEVVDRNDMYYKRISFIVHTHRKSL